MIKTIHITNFKGIKDTVSLELKPITLLFGPNSAGKSSIIQAIHFLKEILERKNYDPRNTAYGGKALNLGGFRNLVHGHDEKLTVELAIELDLSKIDLPGAQETGFEEELDYPSYPRFSEKSDSCKLTIHVKWLEQLERVEATYYRLEINDELLASISLDYTNPKNVFAYFNEVNIDHSIDIDRYKIEEPRGLLFSSLLGQSEGVVRLNIESPRSVIPDWQNGIVFNDDQFISGDEVTDWFGEEENAFDLIDNYSSMMQLVCQVMTGVGKQVLFELDKFRYIGPIREIPSRNFDAHFKGEIERWADGLAAWDLIYTKQISVESINKWLSRFKIGYMLSNEEYLYLSQKQLTSLGEDIKHQLIDLVLNATEESDLDLPLLKQGFSFELSNSLSEKIENIFSSLKYKKDIPTRDEFYLVDQKTNLTLKPHDIGVGISQVLPVIVGALIQNESILAIEQPELHLHPAIQVELADLFISRVNEKADVIYLIETHSEHLMLRFLRRIEETYKNKIKEEKLKLVPHKINVFVIPEEIPMKGYSLPIDKTGEFEKEWPNGFFEEREEELFPDD
ncbi:MAG: AAA family ATPase [Melioribacteraceae bacterium]|nr:MAG: AAA family ATPase [Melioribacteraceae bacterium]